MTAILVGILAGLAGALIMGGRAHMGELRIGQLRMLGVLCGTALVARGLILLNDRVSWPVLGVATGVAIAVVRAVRRRRMRRAASQRRGLVLAACEGLAADLAAGLAPQQALRAMADQWPDVRQIADAAALGADVPSAFRAASELPGAEMLGLVAAAWEVSHRSGAGLVDVIRLAAEMVHAERETARVVSTELAAAKATARLLALLPVGVLVLGRGLGGDPVGFLLTTTTGQLCLALGLGLTWVGGFWLERIAESVERR